MKRKSRQQTGNLLLRQGLLAAPAAAFCVTLRQGVLCCLAFCFLTAVTVLLAAMLPRKLPAGVRILLYSVLGGMVYIPAALFAVILFPDISSGIYLPLLSAGLYLTAAYDQVFPQNGLLRNLLRQLAGTCAVILPLSLLRELLGAGTVWNHPVLEHPPVPALTEPPLGLMLLVFCAAGYSALRKEFRKEAADAACG